MYSRFKKDLIKGENEMYKTKDIANWILANGQNITNRKLQKLVYYAYAWYIALNNESKDNINNRLFLGHFEAWVHGAVEPFLYNEYKKYGTKNIPTYNGRLPMFSDDELDVLNQVMKTYSSYNGNDLESICCQESPWKNARKGLSAYEPSNNVISDADIYECYAARL